MQLMSMMCITCVQFPKSMVCSGTDQWMDGSIKCKEQILPSFVPFSAPYNYCVDNVPSDVFK
jgi:hypothetical protein